MLHFVSRVLDFYFSLLCFKTIIFIVSLRHIFALHAQYLKRKTVRIFGKSDLRRSRTMSTLVSNKMEDTVKIIRAL